MKNIINKIIFLLKGPEYGRIYRGKGDRFRKFKVRIIVPYKNGKVIYYSNTYNMILSVSVYKFHKLFEIDK